MFGGNAKSDAMEAIAAAKKGDFTLADEKIKDAEESLVQAHHSQTEMLTQEAQGNHVEVTLSDGPQSRSSDDIHSFYRFSKRDH